MKRALDRRPAVLLAGRGAGAEHTAAAVDLAALVTTVADRPGRRILDAADPDAPDGGTISRTIAGRVGHEWQEFLLDDGAPPEPGRHPWHEVPPFVLDTRAAEALGYRPVGDHTATVPIAVRSLPAGPPVDAFAGWSDCTAEDARAHRLDP